MVFLSSLGSTQWVVHPSSDSYFHILPISTRVPWHTPNSPLLSQMDEDRDRSTLSPTAWCGSYRIGRTMSSNSSIIDKENRFHLGENESPMRCGS